MNPGKRPPRTTDDSEGLGSGALDSARRAAVQAKQAAAEAAGTAPPQEVEVYPQDKGSGIDIEKVGAVATLVLE